MKNFIIKKQKPIFILLGILSLILLWFIFSQYFNNSLIIPKIKNVVIQLGEICVSKRFLLILIKTIVRVIIIVFVSFVIALNLAVLAYKSKKIGYFLIPIMTVLKTMPVITIIIFLLMTVGIVNAPYVATILVLVPLIYELIFNMFNTIDSTIKDDIKTLSNINFKLIMKFYLPLFWPNIVTSIIQSFGLGFKAMIMAEYISPKNNTFGAEMRRYYELNNMEGMYAIIIIVLIIVLIVDLVLKEIQKKVEY